MMVASTMVIAVDKVRGGWILDTYLEESLQDLLTKRCRITREVKDDSKVLGRSNWKDDIAIE